jgi:hypothetical protein
MTITNERQCPCMECWQHPSTPLLCPLLCPEAASPNSTCYPNTPAVVQLGVAMGNAGPRVKAAADVTVSTNDEGGVAEAIER